MVQRARPVLTRAWIAFTGCYAGFIGSYGFCRILFGFRVDKLRRVYRGI